MLLLLCLFVNTHCSYWCICGDVLLRGTVYSHPHIPSLNLLSIRRGQHKTSQEGCKKCAAGRYRSSNDDVNDCKDCAMGMYQKEQGREFCMDCLPGFVTDTRGNDQKCQPCPIGRYQSEQGQKECTHASLDAVVLEGMVEVKVPQGSYKICKDNSI